MITSFDVNAIPINNASGNVAASATSAGTAAKPGYRSYLCGFEVTGSGATAASVIQVTVTGCVGGTMTYIMAIPAGVNAQVTPLIVEFTEAIPSVDLATPIVVNVPSFGSGNTNAAVVCHGVQVPID